tara:strand:- start:950 stop:1105 length:156 start_codon:yes stop_codon:yes gene_type:complete
MDKKLNNRDAFFADGIFDWQFGGKKHYRQMYSHTGYDEKNTGADSLRIHQM